MRRVLFTLFVFLLVTNSVFAFKRVNINATVVGLEVLENKNDIVYLKTQRDAELKNVAYLPENATIKAEVSMIQKEKRWHKSAYALLKVLNFKPEESDEVIDLSNDDIYLTARKYVPVDLPDAAGTGIELGATTAASFFIPGVDIVYFFTKGAITKEKNPNWFKSGVSEAYDNSIFWFIEKGRSINIKEDAEFQLRSISDKRIKKLISNNENK